MQQGPSYPTKATSHPEIQNYLEAKYPDSNLWPVIWHKVINNHHFTYELISFEKNNQNRINEKILHNPHILSSFNNHYPYYYIDFTDPNKSLYFSGRPFPNFLVHSIPKVNNSYEIVTNYKYNQLNLSTIDIDYLWKSSNGEYRALEVTTFYKEMYSFEEAKRLLSFAIDKRFAKYNYSYHLNLITDVSRNIFNAKLYFVCINTETKLSSNVLKNSNVLWFELTPQVAALIHSGQMPDDNLLFFDTFNNFLNFL